MSQRLDLTALPRLPGLIRPPPFDPRQLSTGILHLGLGAFHRAHMAWYTQHAMKAEADLSWGIHGVSFRSDSIKTQLMSQDSLYSLLSRENDEQGLEIIGSVRDVSFLPDDRDSILQCFSDPSLRIVSLTITEKGYCHDPASGELDPMHPGIRRDMSDPTQPTTAIGLLAEGIRLRSQTCHAPLTVLSCDNLPSNGKTLARVLAGYVAAVYPELGPYVDNQVSFPCSLVDRIVPATKEEDRAAVAELLGVEDLAPVIAERFSQWVIEDDFPAGRPAWEQAGATMVDDVATHELLKLCLLNGPHSACAYLGYLAGFDTVAGLMQESCFPAFIERLAEQEIIPGLALNADIDCRVYVHTVIGRFANHALQHSTWQIAMDGSQKLPQRLLGSAHRALQQGLPIAGLALAIAAWMRFATGLDETDRAIEISDPLRDRFQQVTQAADGNAEALVAGFLGIREIFGSELPTDARFRASLMKALKSLYAKGALQCLRDYAADAR